MALFFPKARLPVDRLRLKSLSVIDKLFETFHRLPVAKIYNAENYNNNHNLSIITPNNNRQRNRMTQQKQIVQVLCVILVLTTVWNIVSMMHNAPVESNETFRCKGTYNHPTCKAKPLNSANATNGKPNIHSSQFTYLVGDNTVCNDPLMIKKGAGRLQNKPIRIGERVYAFYNNTFHPATVIRVHNKGRMAHLATSATTTHSNSNLPYGLQPERVLTLPIPLYYYQQDFNNTKTPNHLSSQTLSKAASNAQHRLSPSSADDKVDVMFDDQNINQMRVQGDQHDLSLNVSTEIRRRPQSELINKCAKQCVDTQPNAWGLQVGSCFSQTCKCECLVPDDSAKKCRNVHRFTASDKHINLKNHTHTELHLLDRSMQGQYLMHQYLTESECVSTHKTTTQPKIPSATTCTASYVPEGSAGEKHPSHTGCKPHCSQYTGEERELCLDKSKLNKYMNKLPTITSLGEGMCPAGKRQQRLSDCPVNHDVKCSQRLKKNCKTHSAGDYYKCQWHEHDPNNALDKNSTGCYDKDMCMFSISETACKQNKMCMWNKDEYYCTKKAYCPSSCSTTTTSEQCVNNPFCRWTNGKCKTNNVIDRQELDTLIKGSPSVEYDVLEKVYPTLAI